MYRDQPRFHREDASYRRIPNDARPRRSERVAFRLSDRATPSATSTASSRWSGCASSSAAGVIGELVDPAFSFMGGIYSARKVRDELAPQIVDELKRAHADAFFLVPA